MTAPRSRFRLLALGALAFLMGATGCRSFDDARVLQTLNQRGFGRRWIGDSNEVVTIGIGDSISVSDEIHTDIAGNYTVAMDGIIQLKMIGKVWVAGFTTDEIAQALNLRYAEFYKNPRVEVFVEMITSKSYFLQGEMSGRKAFAGNTTVFDAVLGGSVPNTADLSNIEVIRPDPVHPLIIPVDLEKMLYHGDARDNILLREDDIVIVNPNLAGRIKNAVELILEPIQPLMELATSLRNIETIYNSFKDDENFYVGGGYGYGGSYGGGYGGGSVPMYSTAPAGGN